MFQQNLRNIIDIAIAELDSFEPVSTKDYTRDNLIELYWQFHPRFRSFKVFASQNASTLDIGSGSGGLFYWKEYLAPRRTDMTMTALDLQKGEHFDKYDKYALFNLDEGDIPFPPCSFDFIFLSHLIEHVGSWKSLLEKCNRLLKSNGIMYIETPSEHTIHLPSKNVYLQKGILCTTVNFRDDLTHVETVNLDEVGSFADDLNIITLEKGFCKNPFLENLLLSFGVQNKEAETCQYGLWSKLLFSSYIRLYKQ